MIVDAPAPSLTVRVRINEFTIPPISDALVIGKRAPIGSEALRKALTLLHVAPFDHISVPDDDVIDDLLVRRSVLRKIPEAKLISLVLNRVKPLMSSEEVLHLELKPELVLEEQV